MNETADIKIFQTFHKAFPRNNNVSWIQPIGVNGYMEGGFISDSSGIQISQLNPSYCELTAQYWVWKNIHTQYVGFYHYRRYLNFIFDTTWKEGFAFSTPGTQGMLDYLSSPQQLDCLRRILAISDIVIPAKYASPLTIAEHYKSHHIAEHWEFFIALIQEKYPQDHRFTELFSLTNLNTVYNIFVMKKSLFDQYCTELFSILDLVYSKFGLQYDSYNNRYIGFLAERFLNFWIYKNNLNYFEVPTLMLEG